MNSTEETRPLVLLTGATGYIGGRLVSQLSQRSDLKLRCLARRPNYLKDQVESTVEVMAGDIFDEESLARTMEGVTTAYYLVHSMGTNKDFEDLDRQAANNFVKAADAAGVERIIYLGGLGNHEESLSKHLRSRQETGDILRHAQATVIEFRAGIVIGSGSLSFELIRALVERLPVMICPKWVRVQTQPIAVEDILAYLEEALSVELEESRCFEVGGPDQCSYGEVMQEYARQRGLRRSMIPVPLLTPHLSSLWLGLVTPIYARIGRKLIESMKHQTVVTEFQAADVFTVCPRGLKESISRALIYEDHRFAETRWSDALSAAGPIKSWGGQRFRSRVIDSREIEVQASSSAAMTPIRQIGGNTGWYYGNWMWKLRGGLDLLVGGVGTRRGRSHPDTPRVGDTIDFWRVEAYEKDSLLRLKAEMKLPGRAWLEFNVDEIPASEDSTATRCRIRQTASFDPVGLFGLAYWYTLYLVHQSVFSGMLRQIARRAEQAERNHSSPTEQPR